MFSSTAGQDQGKIQGFDHIIEKFLLSLPFLLLLLWPLLAVFLLIPSLPFLQSLPNSTARLPAPPNMHTSYFRPHGELH